MNLIDNYCHSVKSKANLNLQCSNKCKTNEILCGKHLNSKKIILFKKDTCVDGNETHSLINDTICTVNETQSLINDNICTVNKTHVHINDIDGNIVNIPSEQNNIIYSKDELFERISNNLCKHSGSLHFFKSSAIGSS